MTIETPYRDRMQCPKCGQANPKPKWHAAMTEGLVRAGCVEPDEHLHWTCSNCMFTWATQTADA